MNLIDRLNALAKVVNYNIPRVNEGGCAVFASHVAYQLKYGHNLNHVVLRSGSWMNDDDRSIDDVRQHIPSNATTEEWNDNGVYFGHVIVEFTYKKKKYHYDSHAGVITAKGRKKTALDGLPLYDGHLSVEEGMQISSHQEGWNRSFSRRNIPKMIKMIHEHLSPIAA